MKINYTDKKTAIITGSSVGLGSHMAEYLAQAGFNVIINYHRKKTDADKLVKKLSQIANVKAIKGDVANFADTKNVIDKTIKRFGRVDVLINNAGIHIDEIVANMNPKSWQNVIDTNLTGVFNFSKAALPQMKKQQFGRIINISSFTAFRGISGAANYSASKAGVIGFTRSLAKEVARYNITANVIAPGYFDIGMFNDFDQKIKTKIINEIPAKRLGQSKEIAELIKIIIASDYLTGQTFVLDGGYSV